MKNQYSVGNAVEIVAPYTVTSGLGCLMGSMFGVASFDAVSGAALTMYTQGTYTLKAIASQAWLVGDLIYWDDTSNRWATNVNTGSLKLIGVALQARASGAGIVTGVVRLNGVFLS